MSIDFPESRKMHITRIFGTNKDKDVLSDLWVDVLRIDEIIFKTQDQLHYKPVVYKVDPSPPYANQWQENKLRLKWADDDDGHGDENYGEDQDDTSKARTRKIVKVCSPDEDDLSDPEEWVPVPCVTKFTFNGTEGNVGVLRRFLARALNSAREVDNRRIVHYDTSIDDDAQQKADDGAKYYRVSLDDYEWKEDTKDKDTYVEHEVVKKLIGQVSPHWINSPAGDDHKSTYRFKNQFLIDATEDAKLDEKGDNDFNPPYRLDPFQNIINCNLGGLAVEFGDFAGPPPDHGNEA